MSNNDSDKVFQNGDLIINVKDGIIDFNALIDRVKSLETKINTINQAISAMDEEIIYLIEQDNKTGEILINHAEVVKSLQEHINAIKETSQIQTTPKKLHISCKLVDEEE